MVKSAIVGEGVSWIFSSIAATRQTKDKPDLEATRSGGLERLEMARIKMEAALQTSNKWQITDTSLLHWRKKLKCAAQDCDDAAHRCRQLSREEDEAEQVVRKSSFPRRVAHATKAFISSRVGCNNDHSSAGSATAAAIRRFEWYAEGAGEFIRYMQLGGTPHQHLFFDPLIGHIFAGKRLMYELLHPGRQYHFFGIRPMSSEERGLEAMLSFVYEDYKMPEKSFCLGLMMRLSKSTNIIGTTVRCLQLVNPHFKSTADAIIKEITQLPTQDFSLVPAEVKNTHTEYWNNIQRTLTGFFRPDPLCCQGYNHENVPSCSGGVHANGDNGNKYMLSSKLPEPVCQMFLQHHISLSEYNNLLPLGPTTISGDEDTPSPHNFPPLKLGILFMPHDSLGEGSKSAGKGSVIEVVDGEKQGLTHVNAHPEQLAEILLPKAITHLYHNTQATTYHICWTSNHGSARLLVEKTGIQPTTNGENTS
ncbi:hypothetical protein VPH35_055735 [Triticum aestivum]|uniref:Uncharacterized protein n=1 Tax=Triticum aestivum TaxID=4565 RepID=A0A077RZ77_WHEAT|nr:unnamed protein product [Triticum aestivum]